MIKSNLEPIEESDLDLERKLKKGEVGIFQKRESPVYAFEKETPVEIVSAERDNAYGKILSKVQMQATDDETGNQDEVFQDAQIGAAKENAQAQVSHLIDLAGQKGVVHAVKVARHMEDNYVLDTFHDKLLADELHSALVSRGMIKEI
ncbi:MAG: hypothetical protein HGA61_03140 [Candidatus Moranbacteria bacterium]|nr:hypothetical protein [Candidatus Moranbacteria bacterium]